ncbi:uncharacterized protein [Penaeus vannamei]|uniref:uncharacterized protein n=1 Tax=Penaeus vannamei TaxID=6689 RepID=UPI00387F4E3A
MAPYIHARERRWTDGRKRDEGCFGGENLAFPTANEDQLPTADLPLAGRHPPPAERDIVAVTLISARVPLKWPQEHRNRINFARLWELSVRDVRLSDAGIYECQMTSHPPSSLFFYLRVVEAQAVIQGEPDVHVHTGVSLKLHCTVELATEPPLYIFWFHNDSMINYAPKRPLKVMKHNFGSSLIINNVTWDDAGSYRCEPHKAKAANLTLHVVEGEKHAALHNGQGEGKEEQPGTSSSAGGSHGERALLTAVVAFCVLLADAALARLDGETPRRMKPDGEQEEEKEKRKDTSRRQRKGPTARPLDAPMPKPVTRLCVSNKEVLCC